MQLELFEDDRDPQEVMMRDMCKEFADEIRRLLEHTDEGNLSYCDFAWYVLSSLSNRRWEIGVYN